MTMTFDEGKPSPEDVLHYGKKGMKWGVRKQGVVGQTINAKLARQKAQPNNKASLNEKLHVSAFQAVRAGGIGKAALKNRAKVIDRRERVLKGQASALEVLREVGHISLLDVAARNRMPAKKQSSK